MGAENPFHDSDQGLWRLPFLSRGKPPYGDSFLPGQGQVRTRHETPSPTSIAHAVRTHHLARRP